MEPEGSLPCSQEPATGPYPEPDESNLHNGLTNGVLPSDFLIKIFMHFSYPSFVLHVPSIPSLTWLP
jgi:hypothetical protein